MSNEFLGIGWKFPVGVDNDGKISMSKHEQDIKESIRIILGTAKGERVMRPDFGCGIHELVFEPINTSTINKVENDVRENLTLWEPRIELVKVEAQTDDSDNGKLEIGIDYIVRSTNNRFNLVYPFYFKEV